MIDLHSHVLPGLDDGAENLDQALAICRAAAADGIAVLAATPHVRYDYPTTPDQMQVALAELRLAVGDLVRLVPGAELDLFELERPVDELRRFSLAGSGAFLLVETPYLGWPIEIGANLFRLRSNGITPILAHPERNPQVQANPDLLAPLVDTGTLVQITAASVDGRLGRRAKSTAKALLDRGLAHLIASDAHAPMIREIGMSDAARAVKDSELATWLTIDVPRAIIEGAAIPMRPHRRRHLFG